jgi:DNA-binding transcriptional LysR family regulator
LNALRAFEVSARYLNFGIAAEELGVTQGAVAQHVRSLEADLGIKLFDQLPRTLGANCLDYKNFPFRWGNGLARSVA